MRLSGKNKPKKTWRFYLFGGLGAIGLLAVSGLAAEWGLASLSSSTRANTPLAPVNQKISSSGLPLPRFVSLKKSRINMRRGPGKTYAVEWVFTKKALPVEIIAEYENWRRIRDSSGDEGWIYHSLLSGKRMISISPWRKDGRIELMESPSKLGEITAFLEPGVQGKVRECTGNWCNVKIGKLSGWVAQNTLWGVYPGEVVN
jgi:SH3-like domain-containing protein